MRVIIFLTLFFTQTILSAQNSIKDISLSITTGVYDDSLKVVAIAKWMTKNLEYDKSNMDSPTDIARAIPSVLRRKKAVCEGYMNLFEALCKESSIQAVSITGYTDDEKKKKDPEVNHGWNAVKINGQWYLMDITWADNGDDYDDIDADYLWADPVVFIKGHFPKNPIWQLVEKPISLECFIWDNNCPDWSYMKKNNTASTDKALALEAKKNAQLRLKQKEDDKKYKAEQKNTELYNTAWAYKTKADNLYNEYKAKRATASASVLIYLLKEAIKTYDISNKYFGEIYEKTGVLNTIPINNNGDGILELKAYLEILEKNQ
jgi:hypothetical protein